MTSDQLMRGSRRRIFNRLGIFNGSDNAPFLLLFAHASATDIPAPQHLQEIDIEGLCPPNHTLLSDISTTIENLERFERFPWQADENYQLDRFAEDHPITPLRSLDTDSLIINRGSGLNLGDFLHISEMLGYKKVILSICRQTDGAPQMYIPPAVSSIPKEKLQQFGTGKDGKGIATDTGNSTYSASIYSGYVSKYLGELADEVSLFSDPKTHNITPQWASKVANLSEFAPAEVIRFGQEIAIGRQLGYFEPDLLHRLGEFRQQIESTIGSDFKLPIDTFAKPEGPVPGRNPATQYKALFESVKNATLFAQHSIDYLESHDPRFVPDAFEELEQLRGVEAAIGGGKTPLFKLVEAANKSFNKLDEITAHILKDPHAPKPITDTAYKWDEGLTPELEITRLQSKGFKVELHKSFTSKNADYLAGGESYEHVASTNVPGLYIGYNGDIKDAEKAVAVINEGLDHKNADYRDFAKQLYAASALSERNSSHLTDVYNAPGDGFVFGVADATKSKASGTFSINNIEDGELHNFVIAAIPTTAKDTQIADTYKALGNVINKSSFATTTTDAQGDTVLASDFKIDLGEDSRAETHHALQFTEQESQSLIAGTGLAGTGAAPVSGKTLPFGQITANSYHLANKQPLEIGVGNPDDLFIPDATAQASSKIGFPDGAQYFSSFQDAADYLTKYSQGFLQTKLISDVLHDRSVDYNIKPGSRKSLKNFQSDFVKNAEKETGKLAEATALVAYQRSSALADEPNATAESILEPVADLSAASKNVIRRTIQFSDTYLAPYSKALDKALERYYQPLLDKVSPEASATTVYAHLEDNINQDALLHTPFEFSSSDIPENGLISDAAGNERALHTFARELGVPGDVDQFPTGNVLDTILEKYLSSLSKQRVGEDGKRRQYFNENDPLVAATDKVLEQAAGLGDNASSFVESLAYALTHTDGIPPAAQKEVAGLLSIVPETESVNGNPLILSGSARHDLSQTFPKIDDTAAFTIDNISIEDGFINYTGKVRHQSLRIDVTSDVPVLDFNQPAAGYVQLTQSNGDRLYISRSGERSFAVDAKTIARATAIFGDSEDTSPEDLAFSFKYQSAIIEATDQHTAHPATLSGGFSRLQERDLLAATASRLDALQADTAFNDPHSKIHLAYTDLRNELGDYLADALPGRDSYALSEIYDVLGPAYTPEDYQQFKKSIGWLKSDSLTASDSEIERSFDYYLGSIGQPDPNIPGRHLSAVELLSDLSFKLKRISASLNEQESPDLALDKRLSPAEITARTETFDHLLRLSNNFIKRLKDEGGTNLETFYINLGQRFKGDNFYNNTVKHALGYEPGYRDPQTEAVIDKAHYVDVQAIEKRFFEHFTQNPETLRTLTRPNSKYIDYSLEDSLLSLFTAVSREEETTPGQKGSGLNRARFDEPFTKEEFAETFNTGLKQALSDFASRGIDASHFVDAVANALGGTDVGGGTDFDGLKPGIIPPEGEFHRSIKQTESKPNDIAPFFSDDSAISFLETVRSINGNPLIIKGETREGLARLRKRITGAEEPDLHIQNAADQIKINDISEPLVIQDKQGATVDIPRLTLDITASGFDKYGIGKDIIYFVDRQNPKHTFAITDKLAHDITWLESDDVHADADRIQASLRYHEALLRSPDSSYSYSELGRTLAAKTNLLIKQGDADSPEFATLTHATADLLNNVKANSAVNFDQLTQSFSGVLEDPKAFYGAILHSGQQGFEWANPDIQAQRDALAGFANDLGLAFHEGNSVTGSASDYQQLIQAKLNEQEDFTGTDGQPVSSNVEFESITRAFDKTATRLAQAGSDTSPLLDAAADFLSEHAIALNPAQEDVARLALLAQTSAIDGKKLTASEPARQTLNQAAAGLTDQLKPTVIDDAQQLIGEAPAVQPSLKADGFTRLSLTDGSAVYINPEGQSYKVSQPALETIGWLNSKDTSAPADEIVHATSYYQALVDDGRYKGGEKEYREAIGSKIDQYVRAGDLESPGFTALIDSKGVVQISSIRDTDGHIEIQSNAPDTEPPLIDATGKIDGYQRQRLHDGGALYLSKSGDQPDIFVEAPAYKTLTWLTNPKARDITQESLGTALAYAEQLSTTQGSGFTPENFQEALDHKISLLADIGEKHLIPELLEKFHAFHATELEIGSDHKERPTFSFIDDAEETKTPAELAYIQPSGKARGYRRIDLPNEKTLYLADSQDKTSFTLPTDTVTHLSALKSPATDNSTEQLAYGYDYAKALSETKGSGFGPADLKKLLNDKLTALISDPSEDHQTAAKSLIQIADITAIDGFVAEGDHILYQSNGQTITQQPPLLDTDGDADGYTRKSLPDGSALFISNVKNRPDFVIDANSLATIDWIDTDNPPISAEQVSQSVAYRRAFADQPGSDVTQAQITEQLIDKLPALTSGQPPASPDAVSSVLKAAGIDEVTGVKFDALGPVWTNDSNSTASEQPSIDADGNIPGYKRQTLADGTDLYRSSDGKPDIAIAPGILDNLQWLTSDSVTANPETISASLSFYQSLTKDSSSGFTKADLDQAIDKKLDALSFDKAGIAADTDTLDALLDTLNWPTIQGISDDGTLQIDNAKTGQPPLIQPDGSAPGYKRTQLANGDVFLQSDDGDDSYLVTAKADATIRLLTDDKIGAPDDIRSAVQYGKNLLQREADIPSDSIFFDKKGQITKDSFETLLANKLKSIGRQEGADSGPYLALTQQIDSYYQQQHLTDSTGAESFYQTVKKIADPDDQHVIFASREVDVALENLTHNTDTLNTIASDIIGNIEQITGATNLTNASILNPNGDSLEQVLANLTGGQLDIINDGLSDIDKGFLKDQVDLLRNVATLQSTQSTLLKRLQDTIQAPESATPADIESGITGSTLTTDELGTVNAIKRRADESINTGVKALADQITDAKSRLDALPFKDTYGESDFITQADTAYDFTQQALALVQGVNLRTQEPAQQAGPVDYKDIELNQPLSPDDLKTALQSPDVSPDAIAYVKGQQLGERLIQSVTDIKAANHLSEDYHPVLGTVTGRALSASQRAKYAASRDLASPDDAPAVIYDLDFIDSKTQKIVHVQTSDDALFQTRELLDGKNAEIIPAKDAVTVKPPKDTPVKAPEDFGPGVADISGLSTLNTAFAVQSLFNYLERGNTASKTESSNLDTALKIHQYVNLGQIGYSLALDGKTTISAVKALYKEGTSAFAEAGAEATKSAIASVGEVAGEGINVGFSVVSAGFDIYELTQAKTDDEKAVIGTQLAFDTTGAVIGGVSLALAGAAAAGFTIAATITAATGGVGAIVAGLGIGVTGLVEAFTAVADGAKEFGKFFDSIDKTYRNNGLTYDSDKDRLNAVGSGVVQQINFQTGKVELGGPHIDRTVRGYGDHSEGRGGTVADSNPFAEDAAIESDYKKDALDIRSGLGYKQYVKIDHEDAQQVVLPVAPDGYIDYEHNDLPGITVKNDTGFKQLRKLEETHKFDFDFYIFPSEEAIDEYSVQYKSTTVSVVLDDKPRTLILPDIPSDYLDDNNNSYTSHDLTGDGGTYTVVLGKHSKVSVDETTGKTSTWVVNIENLSKSDIGDVHVRDNTLHVGTATFHAKDLNDHILVADKSGDVFVTNFAHNSLTAISINGVETDDATKARKGLADYLGKIADDHQIQGFVPVSEYHVGKEVYAHAWYNVSDKSFIYAKSLDSDRYQILNIVDGSTLKDAGFELSGTTGIFLDTQRHQLAFSGSKKHEITAFLPLPDGTENKEFHLNGLSTDGPLTVSFSQTLKNGDTVNFGFRYKDHQYSLVQLSGNSAAYDDIKSAKLDVLSLLKPLGNNVTLPTWIKFTAKDQDPVFINQLNGEAVTPGIADKDNTLTLISSDPDTGAKSAYLNGSVYVLDGYKSSLQSAAEAISNGPQLTYKATELSFSDERLKQYYQSVEQGFLQGHDTDFRYLPSENSRSNNHPDLHRIEGQIYLEKGDHTVSYEAEGDFSLSIAGQAIGSASGSQDKTPRSFPTLKNKDGTYSSERIHDEPDHTGTATVHINKAGFYRINSLYVEVIGEGKFNVHIDGKTLSTAAFDAPADYVPPKQADFVLFNSSDNSLIKVHEDDDGAVTHSPVALGNAKFTETSGITQAVPLENDQAFVQTKDGLNWSVDSKGASTLVGIDKSWILANKQDLDQAINNITESGIAGSSKSIPVTRLVDGDGHPVKINLATDSDSWTLPADTGRTHLITHRDGASWFFDGKSKRLFSRPDLTTAQLVGLINDKGVVDTDAKAFKTSQSLSEGYHFSSIKPTAEGFTGLTSDGLILKISDKGTTLTGLTQDWLNKHQLNLPKGLKTSYYLTVYKGSTEDSGIKGWAVPSYHSRVFHSIVYFPAKTLPHGESVKFIGYNKYDYAALVTVQKKGSDVQKLYQIEDFDGRRKYKGELGFSQLFINDQGDKTLLVRPTDDGKLTVPLVSDISSLVISPAAHQQSLTLDKNIVRFHKVIQLELPATPQNKPFTLNVDDTFTRKAYYYPDSDASHVYFSDNKDGDLSLFNTASGKQIIIHQDTSDTGDSANRNGQNFLIQIGKHEALKASDIESILTKDASDTSSNHLISLATVYTNIALDQKNAATTDATKSVDSNSAVHQHDQLVQQMAAFDGKPDAQLDSHTHDVHKQPGISDDPR